VPKAYPAAVDGFQKAEKAGVPIKLQSDQGNSVWFKQDDTFDQYFVWTKVKISTSDLGFTSDPLATTFFYFWQSMLNQHLREVNYCA
jgi:hypothetical protein